MEKFKDYLMELDEQGQKRSLQLKDVGPLSSNISINLSTNDYLGITHKKNLQKEFFAQLPAYDFLMSSVSSRLLCGNNPAYTSLENVLTAFSGAESALVFSSGYHANTAVLSSLPEKGDLILADKLVHASLIDGMKLSQAESIRFRHLDYAHAEKILIQKRDQYQRVFFLTESVFSMDGDSADAKALKYLKEKYKLFLIVDEAHSFGVMGPQGRGWCSQEGISDSVDLITATFGKACASYGAFVLCSNLLKEVLVNRARSFIFTTALAPIQLMWTQFILNRLPDCEEQRKKLMLMGKDLRAAIRQAGFETRGDSHIVPLICYENKKALSLAQDFQRKGFYVLPIRPPSVPPNTARLRFSLHPEISEADFDELLLYVKNLKREI